MYFDPAEFGKRLQTARKMKDYTQEQLAEKLQIGRNHIAKMESGTKCPSIDLLLDMSEALGVSTDYLLKGTEVKLAKEKLVSAVSELQKIIENL